MLREFVPKREIRYGYGVIGKFSDWATEGWGDEVMEVGE